MKCRGEMTRRTINSDTREVADLLNLGASELERAKVPEDKMVVRSARLELVPMFRVSKNIPKSLNTRTHS